MRQHNLTELWKQFAIFPCKPNDKRPATEHGFHDAKTGQDVMEFINKGYNVGLACAKSNLIVFDLDYHVEDAIPEEALIDLEFKLGELPTNTLTQRTATGKGTHMIFSAKGITKPIAKIGDFIDVRYNAYVVIAPSKINGNQYEIINGIDENGNVTIAELPQTWIDYLNKDTNTLTNSEKVDYSKLPKRTYSDINLEKLFDNCAFLRHCRDDAEELSYNEWFSMVTILAQIEDSDDLIHELSEPYLKYSYSETQKMINEARKFGRPHTCKHISSSFEDVCKGCISAVKKEEIK
ncbi:bifunctional DNA primase/polymerase [bacterium]|nr:bifunctional DNA primase/polymerase [bacterium]